MQITNQKRMAAQILKCGVNRVWIHPSYVDQVSQSVQKEDIREAIESGWIKAKAVQGTSRACFEAKSSACKRATERSRKAVWKFQRTSSKEAKMDANHPCTTKSSQKN